MTDYNKKENCRCKKRSNKKETNKIVINKKWENKLKKENSKKIRDKKWTKKDDKIRKRRDSKHS